MAEKKFSKYLRLVKAYDKYANEKVTGAVKVWLKKPYESESCLVLRKVTVNSKERSVCKAHGSYKVDDFMSRQLKYFFNAEIPKDTFIDIDIGLWDAAGEALSKFNTNEGDLYYFFLTNVKLESFSRKDGSTGYKLNANAFDFEPIKTGRQGEGTPATVATPAPAAPANDYPDIDDIADESGDLPF